MADPNKGVYSVTGNGTGSPTRTQINDDPWPSLDPEVNDNRTKAQEERNSRKPMESVNPGLSTITNAIHSINTKDTNPSTPNGHKVVGK